MYPKFLMGATYERQEKKIQNNEIWSSKPNGKDPTSGGYNITSRRLFCRLGGYYLTFLVFC